MSLYEILEVGPDATREVIRLAYKRLMQRYHPDKNAGDPDAARRAQEIARAFGVLSDPRRRAQYDASRGKPPPDFTRAGEAVSDAAPRRKALTRRAKIGAAVGLVALAAFAATVQRLSQQVQQHHLEKLQLEERLTDERKRRELAERQMQRLEERVRAIALADARDRAWRTVPLFDVHRYVAIRHRGKLQGFILPPADVMVSKESPERITQNIQRRGASLKAAVLSELRQLRSAQLTDSEAEQVVSASIRKVLNEKVLGSKEKKMLCWRDVEQFQCRGVESVIFKGTIELIPD